MLLGVEIGYRVGRRRATTATEAIRSQVNTVLAAMLGMLALLLGFTYSLALQRYEDRSQAVVAKASALLAQVWDYAMQSAARDDRPVTSGLFIQALNEMIDSAERRRAALDRHVPESVLFLVFIIFVMTTAVLGYASSISGHRVTVPGLTLVVLIAFVVYLIIDLDRPRRGVIQVNQSSLIELQRGMAERPAAPKP